MAVKDDTEDNGEFSGQKLRAHCSQLIDEISKVWPTSIT